MSTFDKLRYACLAAWGYATGSLFWYVLMAGSSWLLYYVLFSRWAQRRKINPRWPGAGRQAWEIIQSLKSMLVFGSVAGLVALASFSGIHTRVYGRIADYGWGWYLASFGVAVVVHDAYFYWSHRLLHHRLFFWRVHRLHHLSTNPTPWAAYSFSIGEAYVQAGIGPLLLYTMPMHSSAFVAFMTWQITFNVAGHCGIEILPSWFVRTWPGHILNTPTHHIMHHEKVGANYGLYFNWWDRLMDTNHADYERRYAEVTGTVERETRERLSY